MTGKQYVRPVQSNWWLQKRSYTLFMVRELTSAFIAGYSIFLIVLVRKASHGIDTFTALCALLTSPLSIILHLLVRSRDLYVCLAQLQPNSLIDGVGRKTCRCDRRLVTMPDCGNLLRVDLEPGRWHEPDVERLPDRDDDRFAS